MKRLACFVVLLALVGCVAPADDYVNADAAAWAPFDADGWLDAQIDKEEKFTPKKKDALHELNVGRRARIRHALERSKAK